MDVTGIDSWEVDEVLTQVVFNAYVKKQSRIKTRIESEDPRDGRNQAFYLVLQTENESVSNTVKNT